MRSVISACLDGEVSEVERATLDVHLAACADCRAYAAGLAETSRLLRAAPLEELDFPIALPSHRLRLARTMQLGAAAAAVAATVLLSVTVGTGPNRGLTSVSASAANGPAAYLQSPEYELRMLQRASLVSIPAHAHYAR
ncbi:MAG TPA: zf-HC2 domain-containing protein [Gaiellaceae bacterium]